MSHKLKIKANYTSNQGMSRKVEVYQVLTQTLTEKKNAQLFYCTDG